MLKIYLQIFGTIAVCLIIFLNYNVFVQKPNKEKISEVKAELKQLQDQNAILDQVLDFNRHFGSIEDLQFDDYSDVRVFYANDFNEPRFMQRIQKMIDLSGCTNDGIRIGRITKAAKPATYMDFVTKPNEDLTKSVQSFLTTMNQYYKESTKQQQVSGPESNYASRLMFYQSMSSGKNFPRSMYKGIEIRRFNFTARGNYTECKKLLWLVSQNRPYTQALILGFYPITKNAQGPDKQFELKLVVVTYVDKNGDMMRTESVMQQG